MNLSTKPYLVRSIFDWCIDSKLTPYITVKIIPGVSVPKNHIKNNEIILNLSLESINKLIFNNEFISFSARFDGKNYDVLLPMESIESIYSKENGEGLFFDRIHITGKKTKKSKKIEQKTKKPHLSIVK
ncbi:ClpXP protease specificity-enhancing factor [Methylophilaceae bacterium]|jgi:stringent starvation protein B|nr:ClpXP protease specificity-enhancing factor [Methylophilaceae bacterium]|tara:strand:- start:254 stop:640 length:387 start_codon:yes stop_codon:yes gene_type:complete